MCAFTHIVRFPFFRKLDVPGSEKIAAFDLDGTIVATDSGRDLPVNSSDWRLYNPDVPNKMKRCLDEGFSLVIFSNQGTIKSALDGKAASNSKNRVDQILLKIGLPVQVFFATQKDEYRKPNTGMWEFMVSHCNCGLQPDLSKSFYVGDFAGRSNDKADSDREFARRVGIKFLTPEEFFGPSARGGSSGANAKVVDVLREMAQLLRAKGEGFRANALAKAAKAIEDHVDELKSAKEATKLQGVGKGTGAILEEVRSTGKCAALEELKRESQNDGEAQPDSEPKVVWYHCV
mmetsp:Transcript_24780/g.58997  ORF Transcript_24780/g.58997 Transcript_24780/m.58997 type:complete len:290 (+) Transcript_24780:447-1316(+)